MKLETWLAPPGDEIPNHPSFPVLLYREVSADDVELSNQDDLFDLITEVALDFHQKLHIVINRCFEAHL